MPTENLTTFQDVLSVMGTHRSRLTITPEEFGAILGDLHTRFGTDFQNAEDAYRKLRLHLRGIGGYYRCETTKIDKKSLIRKLTRAVDDLGALTREPSLELLSSLYPACTRLCIRPCTRVLGMGVNSHALTTQPSRGLATESHDKRVRQRSYLRFEIALDYGKRGSVL